MAPRLPKTRRRAPRSASVGAQSLFERSLKRYVPAPLLATAGAVGVIAQLWEPATKLLLPSHALLSAVGIFCLLLLAAAGVAFVAGSWLHADVRPEMQVGLVAGLVVGFLGSFLFGQSLVPASDVAATDASQVAKAFGRSLLAIVPVGALVGIALGLTRHALRRIQSLDRRRAALARPSGALDSFALLGLGVLVMLLAVLAGVLGAEMGGQNLSHGEAFLSVGAIVAMLGSDYALRQGRRWHAALIVGLEAVIGVVAWIFLAPSADTGLSATKLTQLLPVAWYVFIIAALWFSMDVALVWWLGRTSTSEEVIVRERRAEPPAARAANGWRVVSTLGVTGVAVAAWWAFTPGPWKPRLCEKTQNIDRQIVARANALVGAALAGSSGASATAISSMLREASEQYRAAGCREGQTQALIWMGTRMQSRSPARAKTALTEAQDLGPSVAQRIEIAHALGWAAFAQGRYQEALVQFQEARAGSDEGRTHSPLSTARDFEAEAACYRRLGLLDRAEASLVRALRLRQSSPSPDPLGMARAENALARIYRERGRYTDAERLFGKAREALELAYAQAPEINDNLAGVARLYHSQRRLDEADATFRKALRGGGEGVRRAFVLNDLADVQRDMGRTAEAEALYWRALALREEDLGPSHPDVAESLVGLAQLSLAQGRASAAVGPLARALHIQRTAFGDEHRGVGHTARLYAHALRQTGRAPDADAMDDLATRIYAAAQSPS